jgi:hypothetical protein
VGRGPQPYFEPRIQEFWRYEPEYRVREEEYAGAPRPLRGSRAAGPRSARLLKRAKAPTATADERLTAVVSLKPAIAPRERAHSRGTPPRRANKSRLASGAKV